MKPKAAGRSFALKIVRAIPLKAAAGSGGTAGPLVQPRPFLVHALRLRSRRPLR